MLENVWHLLSKEARAVPEERRGLSRRAVCQIAIASCRRTKIFVLQCALVSITVQKRTALATHSVEDGFGALGPAPQEPAGYLQSLVGGQICLSAPRPLVRLSQGARVPKIQQHLIHKLLNAEAPSPCQLFCVLLVCRQSLRKRIEQRCLLFGLEWAQQNLDDRLVCNDVGYLHPTFRDVFVLCWHRYADADPTTGWEFTGAFAHFIGALRRMIFTDSGSQFPSFLFRQHHVLLALQDVQQSNPQLLDFNPISFILRLLQHILDNLWQSKALI